MAPTLTTKGTGEKTRWSPSRAYGLCSTEEAQGCRCPTLYREHDLRPSEGTWGPPLRAMWRPLTDRQEQGSCTLRTSTAPVLYIVNAAPSHDRHRCSPCIQNHDPFQDLFSGDWCDKNAPLVNYFLRVKRPWSPQYASSTRRRKSRTSTSNTQMNLQTPTSSAMS